MKKKETVALYRKMMTASVLFVTAFIIFAAVTVMTEGMSWVAFLAVAVMLVAFLWNQQAVYREHRMQEKMIREQIAELTSVADIYYSMHVLDLRNMTAQEFESNDLLRHSIGESVDAVEMMKRAMYGTMTEEYMETAMQFSDLTTLAERLGDRKAIYMDLHGRNVGWIRMSFICTERDENGVPVKAIVTTQVIDEDKKRETALAFKAYNDELTGLYNRRAYEDDLLQFPDVPPEKDFVYASIDINGLKVVNDSLGHAAGDELIKGAAACLKRTLGNYGKVYRTGGDEFVSMFFADQAHVEAVMKDLHSMADEWRGDMVESLSFSVGYVTKQELPEATVREIAEQADHRMYADKERYYTSKGVDRKGQAAAHSALCNLYTKILKINITTDDYAIVNMDPEERTREKGFADSISGWFQGFGRSGYVHEEDLEEYLKLTDLAYLREYFAGEKTSISIRYRRKYADGYKQVVMELIPANDYSPENQSLFLYVKALDR